MKYIEAKQYFAFNIWDFDSVQAVLDAAKACGVDVILQTSSRVFEAMEQEAIRWFVTYYSNKLGVCAYLHLDHCRNLETIRKAVDLKWDSVMLDASHLPLCENIAMTQTAAKYAHQNGVLLEAEVGRIAGVEDDIQGANEIADFSDIVEFVANTDVDMLAAAVGTSHGQYRKPPNIHYDLISRLRDDVSKPFVIHGGSGLTDNDFKRLLSYENVKKINISTELKLAFRAGLCGAADKGLLRSSFFDVNPVRKEIYTSVRKAAEGKLRLLKEGI